jgi:phospholipid/cholesterol/gamma-HCH transport system permease protein
VPWREAFLRLAAGVGDGTLRVLSYVAGLTKLCMKAFAYVLFIRPRRWGHGVRSASAVHQALLVGVSALPILSLIVFFIGVIMAMQLAHELEQFGAVGLIASGVAVGMTRELGPFMTAVVVLGRSGSAFAAEIGTMKVNQELDALATMALDPVRFLVTPKLVAMADRPLRWNQVGAHRERARRSGGLISGPGHFRID